MKYKLYSIKDELNGYNPPYIEVNEEVAKRSFREKFMLNQSMMITPEDFSLWTIGDFETENGKIISHNPKLIERGQRVNGNN